MPERSLANVMHAYAEDAVDLARERFGVALDFSDESIIQVEQILAGYEDSLPRGTVARMFGRAPSQEQMWQLAKIWGGYLGEVIRRNWGGEWASSRGIQQGADLELRVLGFHFFPAQKVYRRLVNGIEENVAHYYNVLSRDLRRAQAVRDANE